MPRDLLDRWCAEICPVHWGTFDLAMQAWTDPVQRVIVAAEKGRVLTLLRGGYLRRLRHLDQRGSEFVQVGTRMQ